MIQTQLALRGAFLFATVLGTTVHAPVAEAEHPGLSPLLSAMPPYTCTQNWYVDGVHGSDANAGTQASPWKTIGRANGNNPAPTAGTCVNVAPGEYWLSQSVTITHGGNLNTPTGYVVYRSTVPKGAHLIPQSAVVGDIFQLEVPYVVIDGFDIDGNNAITTGNGIDGCMGGLGQTMIAHHFTAINNWIHDLGGSGLASCTADYITWSHNVVFRTSSTSRYQVSAINIGVPQNLVPGSYTPTAADNVPFGIVISYNRAYDNGEGPTIPAPHTDGNGIIVDSSLNSRSWTDNILILGNVAYGNGGGGIHIFDSNNVTVSNNTVYQNYQDLLNPGSPRGELSNGASRNVNWYNNIAIAVPGSGVLAGAEPIVSFPLGSNQDTGTWSKNIAYGARVTSDSTSYVNPATNMIGVNPQVINPTGGQLWLTPGSPAIGAGQPESFVPQAVPDIGAYPYR